MRKEVDQMLPKCSQEEHHYEPPMSQKSQELEYVSRVKILKQQGVKNAYLVRTLAVSSVSQILLYRG